MKSSTRKAIAFCPACGKEIMHGAVLRGHLIQDHHVSREHLERVASKIEQQVVWLRSQVQTHEPWVPMLPALREHSTQARASVSHSSASQQATAK